MPTHRDLSEPQKPSRQSPPRLTREQNTRRVVDNLFSFRTLFAVVIIAAIPAGLLGMLWHPLAYVFYPLFVLLWLSTSFSPKTVRKCPYCRSRVKGSATVCRRCGRTVIG
jgi:hypothetical protein